MTAFGKILVFLNLVFALLTAGLIGMVYLTRTNWNTNYNQVLARVNVNDSYYKTRLAEEAARVTDRDAIVTAKVTEINALKKSIADNQKSKSQVDDQLAGAQRTVDKAADTVKAVNAELERRKLEVAALNETLKDRDGRIQKVEVKLTETRDEAVNANLNYKALKERFDNMMTQFTEVNNELRQFKAKYTLSQQSVKVPPSESVRGTVKAVDGSLVTLSVGTDASVNKDNIMYLYRLSPTAEYLGKVTILSATHQESVGRVELTARRSPIKVGDEASSKILGK